MMHLRTDKEILDLLVVKVAACETRLDSHNRIMESIVRRVRALEQQARPEQEDGHLAVEQRAEAAERARDAYIALRDAAVNDLHACQQSLHHVSVEVEDLREREHAARASVERLRKVLNAYGTHFPACSRQRELQAKRELEITCTCGLTAALGDA